MAVNPVEGAVSSMKKGMNCSQAIFSNYGPHLGIDYDMALKITSAFGGGINDMGNVCGAVTGAIKAIGLKHGGEGTDNQMKSQEVTSKFTNKFKELNDTFMCKELINHDLLTQEDIEHAFKSGAFNNCLKFVKDASEILENLL